MKFINDKSSNDILIGMYNDVTVALKMWVMHGSVYEHMRRGEFKHKPVFVLLSY